MIRKEKHWQDLPDIKRLEKKLRKNRAKIDELDRMLLAD